MGLLTDRTTDGATDLRPKKNHGCCDGHVRMGHARLRSDARANARKATTEALDELRHDDLSVAGMRATGVNHQADAAVEHRVSVERRYGDLGDAQETNSKSDNEDDLIVVREAHDDTGGDTKHGECNTLRLVEVVDVDQRPALYINRSPRQKKEKKRTNP